MSESIPLRKAIERIESGVMRIPGFQRKFVWEPVRAALLMDSIFKGYPIGSILLWRTKSILKAEKQLGGFTLPVTDPDYPLDYVLDGQQRLTSIFSTFQINIDPPVEDPEVWLPIFYDFEAEDDAQEPRFIASLTSEIDPSRHFPLRCFFDPVEFADNANGLTKERKIEIYNAQRVFQEAMLPTETYESEDRTRVAIVFERVNRMGVELDIFELLTAWTWSEDFDLQNKFKELAAELADFGFEGVGEDRDLMLRCCAAILRSDPAPSALIDINGTEVRDNFDLVAKSIKRAIDFVRDNFHVQHLRFLPYSAQIIPLAAYFSIRPGESVKGGESDVLKRWFWRSTFAHRYSGNPSRNIKSDVMMAKELRSSGSSSLDDINVSVSETFFLQNTFNSRTVASKAFILLLIANSPLSFLSGQPVDLNKVASEPSRREYHHCMPRAWLTKTYPGITNSEISCLANFAIITRAENREIRAKAPSAYRKDIQGDVDKIQERALLPASLWTDDYSAFKLERAHLLADAAEKLVS